MKTVRKVISAPFVVVGMFFLTIGTLICHGAEKSQRMLEGYTEVTRKVRLND